MTIAELIAKLQQLPQATTFVVSDLGDVIAVYYHAGQHKVQISTTKTKETELTSSWKEIE